MQPFAIPFADGALRDGRSRKETQKCTIQEVAHCVRLECTARGPFQSFDTLAIVLLACTCHRLHRHYRRETPSSSGTRLLRTQSSVQAPSRPRALFIWPTSRRRCTTRSCRSKAGTSRTARLSQPRPERQRMRRSVEAAYRTLVNYFPSQAATLDSFYTRGARSVDPDGAHKNGRAGGGLGGRERTLSICAAGDGRLTPIGVTSSFPTLRLARACGA